MVASCAPPPSATLVEPVFQVANTLSEPVDTQRPLVSHDGIDLVIGTARDDGKVYIGCGLWVSKEAWGTLFRATSDSMFCRLASTMFWTPDELKNRSVTGTMSNKSRSKGRTEARPALTPQKLSSLKGVLS
ncbi:hypothetical protein HPB49_010036 [Dermacentor silvarum]|uniref:Uncharacterized protein n=1 Tax=Dermacentor silvarum TaxID=543639 RepID=A0ACB8CEH9_DERSI|nr:hypothetical protein HPB49_010036 [Dermacentor silvarum]